MAVQVVVVVALAIAVFGIGLLGSTLIRRRSLSVAGPSGLRVVGTPAASKPAPPPPAVAPPVPDSAEVGVNRRMFLNRAWLLAMTAFGAAFGAGSLAFLWPNRLSGFGSIVNAGKVADVVGFIASNKRPFYSTEGRFYIVTYKPDSKDNMYVKEGLVVNGLMALYQKCAHLGCRVPFCDSSQWFECPCHGSRYNFAGEVQPGSPAPTGLWRFPLTIEGNAIKVDTSKPSFPPAKGVDTLREPPAGPHCV